MTEDRAVNTEYVESVASLTSHGRRVGVHPRRNGRVPACPGMCRTAGVPLSPRGRVSGRGHRRCRRRDDWTVRTAARRAALR